MGMGEPLLNRRETTPAPSMFRFGTITSS